MANQSIPDPSAQLQEWITKLEREFNKYASQFMGTDEFSKSINQMQQLQADSQRMFAEFMTKQRTTFNIPSRDDLMNISESIHNLEQRLTRIEALLEQVAGAARSPQKKPTRRAKTPRTKKPPPAVAS